MDKVLPNHNAVPGYRELTGIHIATVRHFPDDMKARVCLSDAGISWPTDIGAVVGADPYVAWKSPTEKLVLSTRGEPLFLPMGALAPGKFDTAVATILSESLSVHELSGQLIDEWLAHMVDALSIPASTGKCSGARMADVAVFLIRLDPERVWILSDSSIRPYIQNWLDFTFSGAFANRSI